MTPTTCDSRQLVEVLDVARIDQCDNSVLQHVAECDACRNRLEQLAADEFWWSDSKGLLLSADSVGAEPNSQVFAALDGVPARPTAHRGSFNFLEAPVHPELLGQLGKYPIESVIGQGGMGIVLKGFDPELNRTVAIKVLAPQLASSGAARKRFSREARAAAAVVHDHVVAIHGIETEGDLPYIVMPFVGGESLQSYVARSGPLELKDIVRIAMQVASGLAAAHEQGLVHRDIKPANILLENGFGRVLITDFGLARAADDASITRSGLVAGTPHYMSPEQANGHSVDHRSDLFSLGSVIFFMATGRAPFRGEGAMAVLNAICHKAPPSVMEISANLPPQIDFLVKLLLKKDPNERLGAASDLRKLLADYLAHLQNPSRKQLPAVLRVGRRIHLRTVTLTAVAMASVLLAIVVVRWPEANRSQTEHAHAINPTQVALPQVVAANQAVVEDFDGEVLGLTSSIAEVKRGWEGHTGSLEYVDDWSESCRRLDGQILHVQREWSSSLID